MWAKIKKWLGILDFNKDGKVTAEDLELAKALAEKTAKEASEKINKRVKRVKEEAAEVVEAIEEVVDQAEDVIKAAKGKARAGRKKK